MKSKSMPPVAASISTTNPQRATARAARTGEVMADYIAPGQEIDNPTKMEALPQGAEAHLRAGDYVVDEMVTFKEDQALRARRHPNFVTVPFTYGEVYRQAPKVNISGRGINYAVLNGGTKPGVQLDGLAVKGVPLDNSNHGGQAIHEINGALRRMKIHGAPGVGCSGMAGVVEDCWFLDNGSMDAATAGGNGHSEAGQLKSVRKSLRYSRNLMEGGMRTQLWGDCNAADWEVAYSLWIGGRNASIAWEVAQGLYAHHIEVRDDRSSGAMPRLWFSGSKDVEVHDFKLSMPNYNSPTAALVKDDPRDRYATRNNPNATSCQGSWPASGYKFHNWPEPDTKDGFAKIVLQDGFRYGGRDSGAPVEIYDMPDAFKIVTTN